MSLDVSELIISDLSGIGRYSFSRLSTYHTCQYLYDKTYNHGRVEGAGNTFASYGTMAHAILESYLKDEIPLENLEERYVELFSEECSDGIQMYIPSKNGGFFEKDLTELYYTGGLDFFQNFEGFEGMNVLGVEENFDIVLKYKDVVFIFNGFIDLVAEKNGELYVIDHKSKGKFKSALEKQEYRRQLALYALYASYKWKMPVKEGWFNQFRINHIEKFAMTEEVMLEALDWAVDTIKEIESEFLWLPNISDRFYCRNLCDVREDCYYFQQNEEQLENE